MTAVDGPAVVDGGQRGDIRATGAAAAPGTGSPPGIDVSEAAGANGSAANGSAAGHGSSGHGSSGDAVSGGGSDRGASPAGASSGGAPPSRSRAGRDLPAAIAVGLVLGAIILVPLFTVRAAFVGVISVAIATGTAEVIRAVRLTGVRVPVVPLVAGALAMPPAAYAAGTTGLVLTLAVTIGAGLALRLPGPSDGLVRDLAGIAFVAGYVGFPAGFAALLTEPSDGRWRVVAFLGTVVASDVGGYAAGVLSGGRHKMAPSVSPGKSWEGFAGSVIACVIVASVLVAWPLGGEIWQGALLGLATACTATVGDLGESLLKRDIGIKDMGNLLPGHGGIMDRLDSLLCTAPVAWLLLGAFVTT
ncbi:Phosphatidate cytidylyltransferase [Frankia canadensis]|uniref:Phosphatidate cytidylyltransferase n=1 Tax=Frankia canadensis TaxID=1836972 RepID=A0A2I2L238_9ACTN|nr:phosphatidate cytidylyltransferase [Frankia canadensis]SNQ51981.1 Phosphatidate cytidylyltransferase [Frankia canadensis]SOU59271.1 Phosphatidate cytidylyltransferase [Frankia canadensis]